MRSFRSVNPVLKPHFLALPKSNHQYGLKVIASENSCQMILDSLKLKEKYPNSEGNLDIIDVFSGYGLLSTMINYELKPRNHVIIDDSKDNKRVWESRISYLKSETGNLSGFHYYNLDGYSWESYDRIFKKDKLIQPKFQLREKLHDELLIVGNLTSNKTGESLFAQWIQCCGHQNWIQKYGRVRMVLLVREASTQKFLSGPNFSKRNRAALKRDFFTDTRLVAISDPLVESLGIAGESFDPNLLVKDQPVVIPTLSVLPLGGDVSVVEVLPRDGLDGLDINAIDYLCQVFMFRSNFTVRESLSSIAPGAEDDLAPVIPEHILAKKSRMLTKEDMMEIYKCYMNWAFRPTYEETLTFLAEETRNF